ncbi:hypothetical protein P171DRAFT_508294 [Karstenula rhodostoma CBS 690.94]|uniref:Uncharacterized protein n=1 Tax=Karstenula rhodostoma CBS 690.94 TaxID=1392251 RepID=A0A9P4PRZ2_9PLEO|nr:hypothetical protein P171DRAFT_508294 [Karstenula rhodostoma CBS 690.94]
MSNDPRSPEEQRLAGIFSETIENLLTDYQNKGEDPNVGHPDVVIHPGQDNMQLLRESNRCKNIPAIAQIHIRNDNPFEVTIWGTNKASIERIAETEEVAVKAMQQLLRRNVGAIRTAVKGWQPERVRMQNGSLKDKTDTDYYHFEVEDRVNLLTYPHTAGDSAMSVICSMDIGAWHLRVSRKIAAMSSEPDGSVSKGDTDGASESNTDKRPKPVKRG